MNYKKLLKTLSIKENVPVKQLEREMQIAISAAGLNCSVKEFIQKSSKIVK